MIVVTGAYDNYNKMCYLESHGIFRWFSKKNVKQKEEKHSAALSLVAVMTNMMFNYIKFIIPQIALNIQKINMNI